MNQAENLGLNEEKFKYNIERDSVALVYDEDGTVTGKVESRKNIVSDSDVNLQAIEGRVAKVLVYGDEEYRSKYGNDWQKRAEAIVERADDEFNREFDIDLDIRSYGSWSSNGNNSNEILSDLRGSGVTSYDFVIGFTGDNNFTKDGELIGGLAYRYTSNPTYGGYNVVSDQLQLTTAHTLQHELSHNYSLEPDLITSGLICIMNYETMYDTWNWHSAHREQLAVRSGWFGTAIN
ncbi:M12 family metallo-peptidase [Saccharibacillus qingshengii]|uniref:M12 family metallo-peptidase n=1 Tax=Saccharibacillus qingshengii TaxID=1763540 RepID=UPI001555DEEA|nr:M12 family metallo-peptidase [Saccharibacillus qingshengii]